MFKHAILLLWMIWIASIVKAVFMNSHKDQYELAKKLDKEIVPIMNVFEYDWSKFGVTSSYLSIITFLLPFYAIHLTLKTDTPFFYTLSVCVLIIIIAEGYKLYMRVSEYQLSSSKSDFISLVIHLENRFDMVASKIIEGILAIIILLIALIDFLFYI